MSHEWSLATSSALVSRCEARPHFYHGVGRRGRSCATDEAPQQRLVLSGLRRPARARWAGEARWRQRAIRFAQSGWKALMECRYVLAGRVPTAPFACIIDARVRARQSAGRTTAASPGSPSARSRLYVPDGGSAAAPFCVARSR